MDHGVLSLYPVRSRIEAVLSSVGRVEVLGVGVDVLGTAWMVAPGVAVTNRHVALLFARGTGRNVSMRQAPGGGPYTVRVHFANEYALQRSRAVSVTEVLYIADDDGESPDLAFLELDTGTAVLPSPIPLAVGLPVPGQAVVAIGFPAQDPRSDAGDRARLFAGVDVKRLAPGEVITASGGIFTHDCTLGASSGSVLLDVESGQAVGLHVAGRYLEANYAVSAAVVREHLLRAGVPPATVPTEPVAVVPAPRHEATISVADLSSRRGYDESFLGVGEMLVPLPVMTDDIEAQAVPVDDGAVGARRFTLDYEHFSVTMNGQRRIAQFTASNIDGAASRALKRTRDRWLFDPRIGTGFQAGEELYAHNDLDRGHLVRRLDPAWGDEVEAKRGEVDTFFFTNCSPQHAGFNQRLWLDLENYLLENAATRGFRACVFTGPVFDATDPLYRGIRLPRAYWKVATMVHDERDALTATGYVVSQADLITDLEFVFGQFRTYQVPLRRLEALCGLRFGALVDADPLRDQESVTAVRQLLSSSDIVL
jgi:endonuclease G, mitochondrial